MKMKEYEQKIWNVMDNAKDDLIFQLSKAYDEGYKDGKADTPFTDTEEAENKAYNRGLEDAWDVARKIMNPTDDGGYNFDMLREIFGNSTIHIILKHNTASEAMAKIKAYEDKQKQDAEIKVGDEIRLHDAIEVVTSVMSTGLQTIDASGNTSTWYYDTYPLETWKKTGRHFPQIAEVLAELRAEE